MKYLVLGSSGQVGQALVKHLNNQNETVINFDIESDVNEDLRKKGVLDDIIQKVDFIYFLAFDVGGSTYLSKYQNTFDFLQNNILLQAETFESLRKSKKPFIYASSQMSNMTSSPYGLTKMVGELYTKTLNGLIVKFWNVYGIESKKEKFHVITDFITKVNRFSKIEMNTDGLEERQFLHADDCSECLYILSKNFSQIPRDKNLHITSFEWTKIIDVAYIISQLISVDEIVQNSKKDEIQKNKRNEPDDYILKYWQPKITLKEGIRKIIDTINL